MRKFRFVLALFCLFAGLLPASAGTEAAVEAIRAFAEAERERQGIPGMTLGFVKGDYAWVEGFGFADLENRVPAKPESAYRLASVTKPMTAMGVLKLVEMGKIDLDAEVQTYVPYFPRKLWPVTVRLLLGHLGGISHYRNYDLEGHFKEHKDTREAIAVFEGFDLVAGPGTEFHYTSYGYNLLGAVIEGASGQTYGAFMHENVWGPMGMDATVMDDPDAIIPNRVRGYRRAPDGSVIHAEFVDISSRFAAGGTRSTVVDLLAFGRGLMDGKVLDETVDMMFTSMAQADGYLTGYGMGWGVGSVNGRFHASHSGGQAETRTHFFFFPGDRLAIAVACNFESADRMPFVRRVFELVMDEPWSIGVYAGGRESSRLFAALESVYENGVSAFDRNGVVADDEPADAFAYLREYLSLAALEKDFETTRDRIRDGRHPVAGEPFTQAGAFMAAQLVERHGADYAETLHRLGPLGFFDAYATLSRGDRRLKPYRLSRSLEKLVAAWHEDWTKSWTAATRALAANEGADIDVAALKRQFAGSSVYPDYWDRFAPRIETMATGGDMPGAVKLADAAIELYPELDGPWLYRGILYLVGGQADDAFGRIERASRIDPSGAAGPGGLNGWAYRLKGAGLVDVGLGMLEIARRLYPDEANLYDSTGEFYLDKGDREQAIAYYEKALELDPEFANARAALERIRQLVPEGG